MDNLFIGIGITVIGSWILWVTSSVVKNTNRIEAQKINYDNHAEDLADVKQGVADLGTKMEKLWKEHADRLDKFVGTEVDELKTMVESMIQVVKESQNK